MKLVRHGRAGEEKPGVQLNSGERLDVSGFGEDFDPSFFATDGLSRLKQWVDDYSHSLPVLDHTTRLGAPVKNPGKIICIGLNFKDHAKESGLELPEEPIVFSKAVTALCGSQDNLVIPRDSRQTDWEVELAFVIGREARYVEVEEGLDYIAGFSLFNDYSERDCQFNRGGQWLKGKSFDTFAPLGPFLVTPNEIANVNNLRMWLEVNGEMKQNSSTANLIFGIDEIVSYLSQFMTLMPGDIVSTGTPAGVGLGSNPQQFLKPGDVVEYGIEELGTASQVCVNCDQ